MVNLWRVRGSPSRWQWAQARVPPGGGKPARGYYDGGGVWWWICGERAWAPRSERVPPAAAEPWLWLRVRVGGPSQRHRAHTRVPPGGGKLACGCYNSGVCGGGSAACAHGGPLRSGISAASVRGRPWWRWMHGYGSGRMRGPSQRRRVHAQVPRGNGRAAPVVAVAMRDARKPVGSGMGSPASFYFIFAFSIY